MSVTIRCSCGARYTIDQDEPTTETPSADPGDTTTSAHHPGWTDTNLGFTTPALEVDA